MSEKVERFGAIYSSVRSDDARASRMHGTKVCDIIHTSMHSNKNTTVMAMAGMHC